MITYYITHAKLGVWQEIQARDLSSAKAIASNDYNRQSAYGHDSIIKIAQKAGDQMHVIAHKISSKKRWILV